MPRLIVTARALEGLERCRLFLEDVDSTLASKAADAIARHLRRITVSPDIGRRVVGRPHLRELIVPFSRSGYIALYRHDDDGDAVYLLAFRHQREAGY